MKKVFIRYEDNGSSRYNERVFSKLSSSKVKFFRGKHFRHVPVGYSFLKVELNNALFAI